eukprot:961660-Rhodomonas_salina.1
MALVAWREYTRVPLPSTRPSIHHLSAISPCSSSILGYRAVTSAVAMKGNTPSMTGSLRPSRRRHRSPLLPSTYG